MTLGDVWIFVTIGVCSTSIIVAMGQFTLLILNKLDEIKENK